MPSAGGRPARNWAPRPRRRGERAIGAVLASLTRLDGVSGSADRPAADVAGAANLAGPLQRALMLSPMPLSLARSLTARTPSCSELVEPAVLGLLRHRRPPVSKRLYA